MQKILIDIIHFISSILNSIPTLSFENLALMKTGIDYFFEDMAKVGYIVPYATAVKVVTAVVVFRIWKMRLFIKNWFLKIFISIAR